MCFCPFFSIINGRSICLFFKMRHCFAKDRCLKGFNCTHTHPGDVFQLNNELCLDNSRVQPSREEPPPPSLAEEWAELEIEFLEDPSCKKPALYARIDSHFSSSYKCQATLFKLRPFITSVKQIGTLIKTYDPYLIYCKNKIFLCQKGNMCPDLECENAHNLDTSVACSLLVEKAPFNETNITSFARKLIKKISS